MSASIQYGVPGIHTSCSTRLPSPSKETNVTVALELLIEFLLAYSRKVPVDYLRTHTQELVLKNIFGNGIHEEYLLA